MRVYISIDMEGVSGLVRWADVTTRGIDYPRGRSFLTADVNAAVAGAFDAGAAEVVVEENHGVEDLCNVLMDEVDPRCRVIRGAGRGGATTMAGLTSGTAVILLVGHHARAGSRPGIMAHTVDYSNFRLVTLNGRPVGEPDLFAIRGGELGVPIGMVSGDQVVAEQVRAVAPGAEAVIVKHALSNQAADCIPPARTAEMIREGARRAVERARGHGLEPWTGDAAPYEIEVELRNTPDEAMAENLARLGEFDVDGARVRTTAPDMDVGFRRIAYLGYANRPGVIRY
jgi:D-amino peptidase